jgi:putative metallohydrolase (TIGR04338 family)
MSDPQRRRVYAAEKYIPQGRTLAEVPDVQAYVDRLVREPWFRYYWKLNRITVKDGRRRSSGYANSWGDVIGLPRSTRFERYVLHEVAHLVSVGDNHGPRYCRNFVRLVDGVFGRHTAMLLEGAFRGKGCEFAPETVTAKDAGARLQEPAKAVPRPEVRAAGPKCCPTCKRAL